MVDQGLKLKLDQWNPHFPIGVKSILGYRQSVCSTVHRSHLAGIAGDIAL
jgi:hypothetical protein